MNIKSIKIVGFKSVANITLADMTAYSVFAGANGAGKSNLLDAMAFVSAVIDSGAKKAIKDFRGFSQIHCYKVRGTKSRVFEFYLDATLNKKSLSYTLKIHDLDKDPRLEEKLHIAEQLIFDRKKGMPLQLWDADKNTFIDVPKMPDDVSALLFTQQKSDLYQYLTNIRIFRFDPLGAKEPDKSSVDNTELDPLGHNVASMLACLEKNLPFRESVTEWMSLIVMGMEKVFAEEQRLDSRTILKFKEKGTKEHFPANLISDGTIYALCIITAVLSRAEGIGITLIEEPERGIHPQAIQQLIELIRDNARPEHPVFITTHSESVVRASKVEELWLVDKIEGKTILKNAAKNSVELKRLNLDTAWLSNIFGGGLPW